MKIFAKAGSTEKVVVSQTISSYDMISFLDKKYGGNWLLVEELSPDEGVYFCDTQSYKGYEPTEGEYFRYCNQIISISPE